MKVFSILFLGLLFFMNFGTRQVLAEDKSFIISSTNVSAACLDRIVLTPNTINVIPKSHTCPESSSPDQGQVYAATLGGRIYRDRIWFFASRSKDVAGKIERQIERIECTSSFNAPYFDSCDWENTNLRNYGSSYFLDTTKLGTHQITPQSGGQVSAPLDRLLIAGTQGTSGANDSLSFALNTEGIPTGAKGTVFTNPNNKFLLSATMSSDGGMAVQLSASSTSWALSTRKLNNGLASKAPYSWTVPAYAGYSVNISNAIEVNNGAAGVSAAKIRYLVYRQFRGVGTSGQQSQIMIQRIDDATGKPLEAAKPLTPFKNALQATAEAYQSLAIDQSGELLIFTEYSGACKKMILKATKLVNGGASGPAKVISGCAALAKSPIGYLGLDIMEDSEEPEAP